MVRCIPNFLSARFMSLLAWEFAKLRQRDWRGIRTRTFKHERLRADHWTKEPIKIGTEQGLNQAQPSQHSHSVTAWPAALSQVYNTKYSQAVTHPSINFARPGLTLVIRREPVLGVCETEGPFVLIFA